MPYIDILILRHLARSAAHGYELRKRIAASTTAVLRNSSLYHSLERLQDAGAIAKTVVPQDNRPSRHVYLITPRGKRLLPELTGRLPADLAADEAEFLTRMGEFGLLAPPARLAVLDARARAVHRQLRHLHQLQKPADPWATRVTAELVRRAEAEQRWPHALRTPARTPT